MDILPEETSDRVATVSAIVGMAWRRIFLRVTFFPLNKRVSRNVNSNACEALISRMGK